MTATEFAQMIDQRQYGDEITPAEEQLAKEHGLLVVFGCSDDLMELRGAIDDEVDCYNGGVFEHKTLSSPIEAVWCPPDLECAWAYKTTLPHAEFKVYEDDELYCIGIVCDINEKPQTVEEYLRIAPREELIAFLNDFCVETHTGPFGKAFCKKCPTTEGKVEGKLIPLKLHECDFIDGVCPYGDSLEWWLNQPAKEAWLWSK